MSIQPSSSEAHSGIFQHSDFLLLWGGQAVSNLGDTVFGSAILLWIATGLGQGQSWSALAVSGLLVMEYLPILTIGPLAGVFVDRWNRRKTMLVIDGLRTAIIAALTILLAAPLETGLKYVLVLLLVLAEATCAQFFNPARLAWIGEMVEAPLRPQAASLSQATLGLAVVLGPVLATALVVGVGAQWAVAFNALSFGVSYLAIRAIRGQPGAQSEADRKVSDCGRQNLSTLNASFQEGIHAITGSRVLKQVFCATTLTMMVYSSLNTLAPFYVTERLRAPASLFGTLSAVLGSGGVLGALAAGWLAGRFDLRRLMLTACMGLGAASFLLAAATQIPAALAAAALFGGMMTLVSAVAQPLILQVTRPEQVGRVSAVQSSTNSLAAIFSVLLAGAVHSLSLPGLPISTISLHLGVAGLIALLAAGGMLLDGRA